MRPSDACRDRRRSTGGVRRAPDHAQRRRTASVTGSGGVRAQRRRPPWDVRTFATVHGHAAMYGAVLERCITSRYADSNEAEHTAGRCSKGAQCLVQETTGDHTQEWALTPFELVRVGHNRNCV